VLASSLAARPAVASCPEEINRSTPLAVLEGEPGASERGYRFYDCTGVLYLFDPATDERYRVNESWYLFDFESAAFLAERLDRIEVLAIYVTGIGPTGAELFRARIVMQQDRDGGWVPEEATIPEQAIIDPDEAMDAEVTDGQASDGQAGAAASTDEPATGDPSLREVSSAAALSALGLEDNGVPVPLEVDFASARIVAKAIWLTSGSQHIDDTQVRRTDEGYLVFYRVNSPRLGTADMKRSVIYLELPKDGLPVSFHEFGERAVEGRRLALEPRVIDRGAFVGAATP
jgi:hypothetical protein